MFFEIDQKAIPMTEKSQNLPQKSRLVKWESHSHSVFDIWHLQNRYLKMSRKKPRHLVTSGLFWCASI